MANKADLVSTVSQNSGVGKAEAQRAVDAVLGAIGDTVARGEDLKLVGFGTFKPVTRKARTSRNPQNGAPIHVPERRDVRFTAGTELKGRL